MTLNDLCEAMKRHPVRVGFVAGAAVGAILVLSPVEVMVAEFIANAFAGTAIAIVPAVVPLIIVGASLGAFIGCLMPVARFEIGGV